MKYDWLIERLDKRVKRLEEVVAHLEKELEKSSVVEEDFHHKHYYFNPYDEL